MKDAAFAPQTIMEPESQASLEAPLVPQAPENKPIAPLWHTVILTLFVLVNSYGASGKLPSVTSHSGRFLIYSTTFITQLLLFLFVWFGLRLKGVRMRDLIGGRWATPKDFFVDVGIAAGFWVVSGILRSVIAVALHLVDVQHPHAQMNEMKRAVGPVLPQNGVELAIFLVLTMFAGFFEEIIFRGYLQRQLGALAKNIWFGVLASAALFGAAHGYQGARLMVLIGIYGAMFGVLAVMRKSLRPGMIAHAAQDAFSGLGYFLLTKKGLI